MTDEQTVDLTNCDVEPIHIPGSIQPHGCLLACDMTAETIVRHSVNAQDMLGKTGAFNGQRVDDVVGQSLGREIRNALVSVGDTGRPALLFGRTAASGRRFDIAVHRYKGTTIIEFEPAEEAIAEPLELSRAMLGRVSSITNIDRLVRDAAKLIQAMLGYDRVMIYQFGPDGAGKVMSEAKRPHLESFLGQYFPATDIPKQARELYLKNTIRIISDASFKPVRVEPAVDLSGEPLDLSLAHLRSVSPIHCEYLRNMGVGASMSVSIIVDGTLWGLIACHHYGPRTLSMAQRVAAEIFGEFFSLHLNALRHMQLLEAATTARHALDTILQEAVRVEDVNELLRDRIADFGKLMPADGLAIWLDGKLATRGSTPPVAVIPELARFAGAVAEGRIWATHNLSNVVPGSENYAAQAAGMLVIPLSQRPRDYVFFFRKEVVQTLNWAGNPEKTYETGPLGDRLTPRKSFAIWKETVHQQSQPWTDQEREFAEAARSSLVGVLLQHSELLADERAKAAVRQRMLNEELNHRVKNILAVIKSLVNNPSSSAQTLDDYVEGLRGRIQALSFAHDQVSRGDGGGALNELLDAELLPYRTGGAQIDCSGPNVWMDARSFSIMALVLHELSTNAAKYGALSRAGGQLTVSWRLDSVGACEIEWLERGGPNVTPPSRRGFGTVLIDRSIPFDLNGESNVQYNPEGVFAQFRIPPRFVSLRVDPAVKTATTKPAESETGSGATGKVALIVEDQMLIAMDLEQILEDNGITVAATATSPADALKFLANNPAPDMAVLDINLGDQTSEEVATALIAQGVPFIFATGYGDGDSLGEAFADVPVVRKPYSEQGVMALLNGLF